MVSHKVIEGQIPASTGCGGVNCCVRRSPPEPFHFRESVGIPYGILCRFVASVFNGEIVHFPYIEGGVFEGVVVENTLCTTAIALHHSPGEHVGCGIGRYLGVTITESLAIKGLHFFTDPDTTKGYQHY